MAQGVLDQASAAERVSERTFRKQFQDAEELLPELVTLSKHRSSAPSPAAVAAEASTSADAFPPGLTHKDSVPIPASTPPGEKPAELDSQIWERFLSWYEAKTRAEYETALLQAEQDGLNALLGHLQTELSQCAPLHRCASLASTAFARRPRIVQLRVEDSTRKAHYLFLVVVFACRCALLEVSCGQPVPPPAPQKWLSCRVSSACAALLSSTGAMNKTAQHDRTDLLVALTLKNGAVEVPQNNVGAGALAGAALVSHERVATLTAHIRERQGLCIRVLEEIRDFKVGIYSLLWECKRLDMEGDDRVAHIRELQMLRVTADLNQVGRLTVLPWNQMPRLRQLAHRLTLWLCGAALQQPWKGEPQVQPGGAAPRGADAALGVAAPEGTQRPAHAHGGTQARHPQEGRFERRAARASAGSRCTHGQARPSCGQGLPW